MHGEAVGIDVLFSSYLSYNRGYLSDLEFERIINVYKSIGLLMWDSRITPDLFWDSVDERIMHRNGKQSIPVPSSIGTCDFINDLSRDEVCNAVKFFNNKFREGEAV